MEPHPKIFISDLKHLIEQLPEPFLVVGNFNARSNLWVSAKTNTKGQIIEDFLLSNNIYLLPYYRKTNLLLVTTVVKLKKMSCIDLFFCQPFGFIDCEWDDLNYL